MEKRFLLAVLATLFYVPACLSLDREGLPAQLALGAATVLLLWLIARRSGVGREQIVCAVILATCGEVVFSLIWGLYTYQHALIPLYVPPGHGIFYCLAAYAARQPLLEKHQIAIRRGVLIVGSLIAAVSLAFFADTWGTLWWLGAAALLLRAKKPVLLSACFVFTTLMEWAGTGIGNWIWHPVVPGLGLSSANPPAGVGILYVILDLLVVLITSRIQAPEPPGAAVLTIEAATSRASSTVSMSLASERQGMITTRPRRSG